MSSSPSTSAVQVVDISQISLPAPSEPLRMLADAAGDAERAVLPMSVRSILNPALRAYHGLRSTVDDDAQGFGPTKKRVVAGKRQLDNPVCTDETHETDKMRLNQYRQKSGCRSCIKEAVARLPDQVTRFQRAAYLHTLCKGNFCVFCFLESEKEEAHLAPLRHNCPKHEIANGYIRCDDHGLYWRFCTKCKFDPRAGTSYCACGVFFRLRKTQCTCAVKPVDVSYGIRFNSNPFELHTGDAKKQDDEWARYSLERAEVMQNCADVLRDGFPAKKRIPDNIFANGEKRFKPRISL